MKEFTTAISRKIDRLLHPGPRSEVRGSSHRQSDGSPARSSSRGEGRARAALPGSARGSAAAGGRRARQARSGRLRRAGRQAPAGGREHLDDADHQERQAGRPAGAGYSPIPVGRATKVDIALLRIKPTKPLAAVKFGDSDGTRVGDWVLAIGNPFGLGGTVTAGILSARAREINAGPYDDFLQTDASINRGNSGGPMFNMAGEVIGINTAIYSPSQSGGSIGIGFAIPANLARPVVEQLKDFGHARRGWLGVNIQSVTDEIAESLGLDKPKGALIASVRDGGPAQVAGVQAGDVVLTFDGKDVTDMRHLPRIVAETPIDRTVKVKVWRKRKEHLLDVKVGELNEDDQQAAASPKQQPPAPVAGAVKALGLSLANITPELRERFSLSEDTAGVVVTDVATDSPASEKGMRAGDVIVEVAQEEVKNPGQITAKIDEAKKAGRKSVLMLVDRQGDLRFVALKVDQS